MFTVSIVRAPFSSILLLEIFGSVFLLAFRFYYFLSLIDASD
jgi:hypothetical protein